jgi:hypothetical protein
VGCGLLAATSISISDADHGLASFDGVGRPAHWIRARGITGVEAAGVRAPCCVYLLTKKKTVVAKGVQPRLLRQRVVMAAQKAQADVLLHRLHYALPGWDAAFERRDAQDEFHSAAQARAWADGDFDADHGLAFDGVGRPARIVRAGRAAQSGWRRRMCARPCCV